MLALAKFISRYFTEITLVSFVIMILVCIRVMYLTWTVDISACIDCITLRDHADYLRGLYPFSYNTIYVVGGLFLLSALLGLYAFFKTSSESVFTEKSVENCKRLSITLQAAVNYVDGIATEEDMNILREYAETQKQASGLIEDEYQHSTT